MFRIQKHPCATCIYRPDSPLDLATLEAAIAEPDQPGEFRSYRICHHSRDVCCHGFWSRHRNHFNLGRIAQRLGAVEEVEVDVLDAPSRHDALGDGVSGG